MLRLAFSSSSPNVGLCLEKHSYIMAEPSIAMPYGMVVRVAATEATGPPGARAKPSAKQGSVASNAPV